MTSAARLLGAALVALALLPAGSLAAGSRPVTIDSYGFWSLHKLGYGDVVLNENERTARTQVTLAYRLPPGAHEGPGSWYLIRLHFRVEVRPDTLDGEFNVAADTNGRTCASIIFDVTHRNGRPYVVSDELGLVGGVEKRGGPQLVREIDFRNFLVIHGVKPGLNRLTLDLTSNAVPMVRRVRVFGDSGIELVRSGPPSATLTAHVPEHTVRVGETFHVQVEVVHQRGIAVPAAKIRLDVPAGLVAGTTFRRLAWGTVQPLRTTFALRALRAGRVPLVVHADAGGTFPSSQVVIYVDRK